MQLSCALTSGTATVYFTSIRQRKGEPFEVLRFLVTPSDSTSRAVSLLSPAVEQDMASA